jgi:hypothetical protein
MASIQSWSFTRLWAVSAFIWLVAAGMAEVADYFDVLGLAVLAVAFLPAFLAGAWAGEHPEIQQWPRIRLIAMWVLVLIGFGGATDFLDHWKLAAAAAAAPVTILTIRWYELVGSAPALPPLPPPVTTEPRMPAAGTGSDPVAG